jgi:integrase
MRQFRATATTAAATTTEAATPEKRKRKKPCRFKGTDHFLSRAEFDALCAASEPFYATLWKVCIAHALRISEALAIRPGDIQCGYLTVKRLKGSQTTVQRLLVNLDEQIKSGTYRLFPISRSSAFLHFRASARKIGLHPDLCHPHVLRHSAAHWMLDGGANLAVTSQWLGHTSLASTSAYLRVSDMSASAAAEQIMPDFGAGRAPALSLADDARTRMDVG